MRALCLACLAMFVVGCSGSAETPSDGNHTVGDAMSSQTQTSSDPTAGGPPASSTERKQFEDDVLKVPVYPGATEVPNTRMIMDTDVVKSYNCSFQTSDDTDKVGDFYKAEAQKVGKLIDMPLGQERGKGLRVVAVEVSKKEKIQIQASKSAKDNSTIFSVHYAIQK